MIRGPITSSSISRSRANPLSEEESEWLLRSTELTLGDQLHWNDKLMPSDMKNFSIPNQFPSHREYIIQAESVMKSWLQFISNKQTRAVGNTSATTTLESFAAVQAAQVVENILKSTLTIYNEWEDLKLQNNASYLTTTRADLLHIALAAWVRCRTSDSIDSSIMLLQLLQTTKNGQILTYANEENYHSVIKACILSKRSVNLEKAIKLLEEMSNIVTICPTQNMIFDDEDDDDAFRCTETKLYPNTQTYDLVLYGLANCKPCVKNAQRAESLLHQMISHHKSASGHDCHPKSNTFRQVVSAWTKCSSKQAVQNARRILDMMLTDFPSITPDASTYNAIMTLYLRQGNPEKVLQLFTQLIDGRTKPDNYSVNLMLRARTYKPNQLTEDEMEETEDILLRMRTLYDVRQTCQSYNVIIDAWAKSGLPDSANRAEDLLDIMEKQCRAGDMSAVPDAYSFTSVLNAISRAKYLTDNGSRAENVLQRMRRMHDEGLVEAPTTPVYNAVLNALITSNERGAHNKAKSLFTKMAATQMANTRSYNIMIKSHSTIIENEYGTLTCYSKPSKAKALLYQMEQNDDTTIAPDAYSYATLILAYSRSNAKRKAMKAFGTLRKCIDAGIKPTTHAFNGVLTACAHTYIDEEKVQAFSILINTLILIRQWAKPDDTTYRMLLKACERLLPSDEAKKAQVISLVLRELKFQCDDPNFHASMIIKFMNMDSENKEAIFANVESYGST